MGDTGKMDIIDCFGTPRARGHGHGESLRRRIADALGAWETATMAGLGARAPKDIDSYCAQFLAQTTLITRAQAVTPDLMTEMEGIAAAAGQPLARIAAYNLMDEQWWHEASVTAPPPGCSLIVQPVEGGHVLAQNMDLPAHMEGSQVALRLGGDDMVPTIVLSAAGMIGLTGATAAGLAVGVNTLLMLNHAADGLPVAFAMRHALGARDRAEGHARLSGVTHASGQHYALATRSGVTSLECSATSCAEVPVPGNGRLLHTNHPLVSTDIDTSAQTRLGAGGFNESSTSRLDWLEAHQDDIATADDVQVLFDDPQAPICMRPETNGGSSTFATVLYAMTDRPSVRMRQGGADNAAWQAFDLPDGGL